MIRYAKLMESRYRDQLRALRQGSTNQTGFGTHSASYPMVIGVQGKEPELDRLPLLTFMFW